MDLMFAPLRKYAEFNGRARRTEFWLFFLFRLLVYVALAVLFVVVVAAMGGFETDGGESAADPVAGAIVLLVFLVWLGFLLPELAVTVRRLHDVNMSGWLVLLALVPFGGFVLFIFSLLDGTAGSNTYGPDPKGGIAETAGIFT